MKSNKELKVLFEAINGASESIVITDPNQPDNPIIFVNKAFTDLTGYQPEEIVGKNCRFLQGKETDKAAVKRVRGAVVIGSNIKETLVNYRKDGSKFLNRLSISTVNDDKGRLRYFIGIQHAAEPDDSPATDYVIDRLMQQAQSYRSLPES